MKLRTLLDEIIHFEGGNRNGKIIDPAAAVAAIADGLVLPHPGIGDKGTALAMGAYMHRDGAWWLGAEAFGEAIMLRLGPTVLNVAAQEMLGMMADEIVKDCNTLGEAELVVRDAAEILVRGSMLAGDRALFAHLGFGEYQFAVESFRWGVLAGMVDDRTIFVGSDGSMFLAENPVLDVWMEALLRGVAMGMLVRG